MANVDTSDLRGTFFGKVAAAAAWLTANATEDFDKKLRAVSEQTNEKNADSTTGAVPAGQEAGDDSTQDSVDQMTSTVELSAMSMQFGFMLNQASSIQNKASEGVGAVSKAG